jgi:hypothetical protein
VSSAKLPTGWTRVTPSTADRSRGVIAAVAHRRPAATVIVRRIRGRLTGRIDLAAIGAAAQAALAKSTTGFEPVNRTVVRVSDADAAELVWDETGKDGATFRSTMLIVPTRNESFYVTLRCSRADAAAIHDSGLRVLRVLAEAAVG